MSDAESEPEYLEIREPLEKPKTKKILSEKQKDTLAKGRAKKVENQQAAKENKESKRLEDRFDKLVAMFEQVKLPPVEVQAAIKKKRVAKPPPVQDESEEEDVPQRIERPRASVVIQPQTKRFSLAFV